MVKYNPVEYYTGKGSRVTSPFGWRTHPVTGKRAHHNGVDFAMKRGAPLPTPYGGLVKARGLYGAAGRTIAILIAPGIVQLCFHLDSYNCKVGDMVKPGDIIGAAGASGTYADGTPSVTGPHLHYELRIDNGSTLGSPVWGDPAKFYLHLVQNDGYHEVVKDDTLGKIAQQYGVVIKDLVEWNAEKYPSLLSNPGLIRIGWILAIAPPKPEVVGEYIVVRGDVLWRIAKAHNVTVDEILVVNPQIVSPDLLQPGDVIFIPAAVPGEAPVPELTELEKAQMEIEELKCRLGVSQESVAMLRFDNSNMQNDIRTAQAPLMKYI